MRYQVIVSLSSDEIPKDKNRMFLSLIKYHITENDKQFFESLYAEGETKRKDFTFSLYMPECEFLMDTIKIPNKKIFLNFSTLISHKAAYLTLKDIRCAVCDKFIRVPMGYFDKNSHRTR